MLFWRERGAGGEQLLVGPDGVVDEIEKGWPGDWHDGIIVRDQGSGSKDQELLGESEYGEIHDGVENHGGIHGCSHPETVGVGVASVGEN